MNTLTLHLVTNPEDCEQTISLDIHSFVHKRLESFVYKDDISISSVPLAYIDSQPLLSNKNIGLIDRSYSVYGNSILSLNEDNYGFIASSDKIASEYSELLITNMEAVDEVGNSRPLFYCHILRENTVSVKIERINSEGLTSLDKTFLIALDDNKIYTEAKNTCSLETGKYDFYMITSTDSDGIQLKELLSLVPVAREAEWEDIDLETGLFKDGVIAFTKEKNSSGYSYYLSESDQWFYSPKQTNQIKIKVPNRLDIEDSWYLEISNGDFFCYINGALRRYWCPEYYSQDFFPSFSYKFSQQINLNRITSRFLKCNKETAIDVSESRNITLYIYDYENNLIKIWTTDASLEGNRFSNSSIKYELGIIESWDNSSGLIYVNEDILASWRIEAEVFTKHTNYTYKLLNFNPLENESIINKLIVIYLVPDRSDGENSIHHLICDEYGNILSCSQNELKALNEDGTINLNSIIGKNYLLGESNFFINYSAGQENDKAYLILGEATLKDVSSIGEIDLYEINQRGKQVISFDSDTFSKSPKALLSEYGYGNRGLIYPTNNSLIIKPPVTLLEEYGGVYIKSQAEQIMKKFVPAGVYCIFDWLSPNTEFACDNTVEGEVTINVLWEGPAYLYRLYRRVNNSEPELLETFESLTEVEFTYVDTDYTSGDYLEYEVKLFDSYEYESKYKIGLRGL